MIAFLDHDNIINDEDDEDDTVNLTPYCGAMGRLTHTHTLAWTHAT